MLHVEYMKSSDWTLCMVESINLSGMKLEEVDISTALHVARGVPVELSYAWLSR